jgi:hypothetical protein
VADTCPGNGPTCGADEVASTAVVCRPVAGTCDVAENCDGVGTSCPADLLAAAGTACDDGDPCTTGDVCAAGGACAGPPVDCDDGDACTDDSCDADGISFLCVHEQDLSNPGCQLPVACGNLVLDPGETCDPPDPALDPVTFQPLCRPDCTRCGDGVLQTTGGEACDDGNTVSGCNKKKPLDSCQNNCTGPICNDPGQVKLAAADGLDMFKFHGMLITNSSIDFVGNHLVTELRDTDDNLLYRVSLPANSLVQVVPKMAIFKNLAAKTEGGPMKVKIKGGNGYYKIYATAYGQLDATVSDMQLHVYCGAMEWSVRGQWVPTPTGWRFGNKSVLLPVL